MKDLRLVTLLTFFATLLAVQTTAFSQPNKPKDSLDKLNKEPTVSKTTPKVIKPAVKPPVVIKKVEPPPPKKVVIPPKPKKAKVVPVKEKRSKFIKVLFTTPETGLEIEVDKKSFYVNKDARIEIPLTAGKHFIYVKRNGQEITDLLELTVSADQDAIDLAPYIKEFTEETAEKVDPSEVVQAPPAKVEKTEQTKEENDNSGTAEVKSMNKSVGLSLVSQNIINILVRFYDPKLTDNVTLNDWNYIYQQTLQNETLPNYTKEKINLLNKFAEGQINLLQGNFVQAVNSFEGSLSISVILKEKLRENNPMPHYGAGLAYLATKDYKRAIDSFLASIRIDPKFGVVYSRLGDALKASGRGKEALGYYLSAYKNGYKTFESSLNLATGLKLYESYPEAIKLYQELAAEKPLAEIYIAMGDCFIELKQNIRAIDSYRDAIKVDKNSAVAYLRLGNMYVELKDLSLAIDSWQKALDYDKEGKVVNRKKVEEMIKKAKKRTKYENR
jgi:tetratricopeptide (TPR) repeat protein